MQDGCALSYSSSFKSLCPSFSSALRLFAFTSFFSPEMVPSITHCNARRVSMRWTISGYGTYSDSVVQSCLAWSMRYFAAGVSYCNAPERPQRAQLSMQASHQAASSKQILCSPSRMARLVEAETAIVQSHWGQTQGYETEDGLGTKESCI